MIRKKIDIHNQVSFFFSWFGHFQSGLLCFTFIEASSLLQRIMLIGYASQCNPLCSALIGWIPLDIVIGWFQKLWLLIFKTLFLNKHFLLTCWGNASYNCTFKCTWHNYQKLTKLKKETKHLIIYICIKFHRYLWRYQFNEFIQESIFSNFTVESLTTVFDTGFN